tara:strand:- start:4822 stop:5847 length:1026 start_codon:yes stop_codon:yes gene_type:complete
MKQILNEWNIYLNEIVTEENGYWFELTNGFWKALSKSGIPNDIKLGFDISSFNLFSSAGENIFDSERIKLPTTFNITDKRIPNGFYIFITPESEEFLKNKSKWLNRKISQTHKYYGLNYKERVKDLFQISKIKSSNSRTTLDIKIREVYNNAVNQYNSTFDTSHIEENPDLVYHIFNPGSSIKQGQIIKPYFTGTKATGFFGSTDNLESWETLLEENRPRAAPSRLNAAFAFKDAASVVAYNLTWKGDIWQVETLGKTIIVDMRIAEKLEKLYNDYREYEENLNDYGEQDYTEEEANSKMIETMKEMLGLVKKYWNSEAGSNRPVWEVIISEPGFKAIKKI